VVERVVSVTADSPEDLFFSSRKGEEDKRGSIIRFFLYKYLNYDKKKIKKNKKRKNEMKIIKNLRY
jgi:hypothetical protein